MSLKEREHYVWMDEPRWRENNDGGVWGQKDLTWVSDTWKSQEQTEEKSDKKGWDFSPDAATQS